MIRSHSHSFLSIWAILILATASLSGLCLKRPWTYEQEAAANNLIREYQDVFQVFSSIHDEKKGARYMFEILDQFSSQRDPHYYDLFEEYDPGLDDVEDYLFTIKNEYNCNLVISFEPLGPPETVYYNDKKYARYILKKNIRQGSREKTVTNVVYVDIDRSQPKIRVIGLPEHFPEGGCQSITAHADQFFNAGNYLKAKEFYLARLQCSEDEYAQQQVVVCNEELSSTVTSQPVAIIPEEPQKKAEKPAPSISTASSNLEDKLVEADALFEDKKYQEALTAYQVLKERGLDDSRITERVAACKQEIHLAQIKTQADDYYTRKEYASAKKLYQEILEYRQLDRYAQERLEATSNMIRYEQHKAQGDHYFFEDKFYFAAREQYESALKYKPDDDYARTQIVEVETALASAESSVPNKVKSAITLWQKGKLAESFVPLFEVEDSKLLKPGHYYMLGEAAIMEPGKVARLLNKNSQGEWDREQVINLGVLYLSEVATNENSQYQELALKRYCDLRKATIQALQIEELDCEIIYKER
jgi:tetratricopeptide (TPR) repeat protein